MQPEVAEQIRAQQQIVHENQYSAEAWGTLGAVLQAHQLFDEASRCYQQANRLDPRDFRWSYLHAVALESTEDDPRIVLERLEHAAGIKADFAPLWVRRGRLHEKLQETQAAAKSYRRAIELKDDHAAAHYSYGQLLQKQGEVTAGLPHLQRAAELVPENASILSAVAQAQLRVGNSRAAEAAMVRARAAQVGPLLDDPLVELVLSLGSSSLYVGDRVRLLLRTGDAKSAEAAIPLLQSLERVQPDGPFIALRMALAQCRVGQIEASLRSFERAEALRNKLVDAANSHGLHATVQRVDSMFLEHYRELLEQVTAGGDQVVLEEVIKGFRMLLARTEPTPVAYLSLGNAVMELGRTEEAVELYHQALSIDPGYAKAYYNLGVVAEKGRRIDTAVEFYRKAVELDPMGPAAKRLDRLSKLGTSP